MTTTMMKMMINRLRRTRVLTQLIKKMMMNKLIQSMIKWSCQMLKINALNFLKRKKMKRSRDSFT